MARHPKGVSPPELEGKRSGRRKAHRSPESDINAQVGILLGCEWKINEIAEHFGVTHVAIVNRRKRHQTTIDTIAAFTRVAISKYVAERIDAAEDKISARKKRVHAKGFMVVEKALDHALSDEVTELGKVHMQAAEMGIERTEGKAVDYKSISEQHTHTIQIDAGQLEDVLRELSQLNSIRRPLLNAAGDIQEAELVTDTTVLRR